MRLSLWGGRHWVEPKCKDLKDHPASVPGTGAPSDEG